MSELYELLLTRCKNSNVLQESTDMLPDEITLQAIWFSGQLGRTFTTIEGKKIEVKQFGFWNKSAGPDFLHTSILVEGETLIGDIELDHSTKHWSQHRHHENTQFNKVILHVSFTNETQKNYIKTQSNSFIHQVIIPYSKFPNSLTKPEYSLHAQPGRCNTPLQDISSKKIEKLLFSAAQYRVTQKAKKFRFLLQTHGKSQAMWVSLAETLGYKKNTFIFHTLSQRIPIQQLITHSPEEIQAILFGASGFLHPDIHKIAKNESKKWLEALWKTWWQLRHDYQFSEDKKLNWALSGIRPVNHPQRRLAALAAIASDWAKISHSKDYRILRHQLSILEDPFWNFQYTLTSKRSKKSLALVGQSRINSYLTNYILPTAIAFKDERAWQFYKKIPAATTNSKVKRASDRLFGENKYKKEFLQKSWHHQALLQIYQDFCMENIQGCDNCSFPETFQKWAEDNSTY